MIDRFKDHAANERTMLAWVRTALAMVTFGFLVEKLSLFLILYDGKVKASDSERAFANWAGIIIIAAGSIVMVVALYRYFVMYRRINSDKHYQDKPPRLDIAVFVMLAAVIIAVCAFMFDVLGSGLLPDGAGVGQLAKTISAA